jgi:hypothetical protein
MKTTISVLSLLAVSCFGTAQAAEADGPVKVFILAGDENCLEQGVVSSRTEGVDFVVYPNEKPMKDEVGRHVNCSVYKGAYKADADYDKLTPEVTGIVALGESQAGKKKPKLFTPFPEQALKEGYTTVLRGYLTVPQSGEYEVQPGADESAFNFTTIEGKEVWRRDVGQAEGNITPMQLSSKKRYAIRTIYFKKPGHEFRVPQVNRPGTLEIVMAEKKQYAVLKDAAGQWSKREDVILYDAQPIHNDTRAPGHPLQIPDDPKLPSYAVGPELMLGNVLGNHYDEPVFLLRFATRQGSMFGSGSRSLGHDYLPPSAGSDLKFAGNWDVIHFNFGVWDATYRESTSKYFSGHNITSVEDFEKNLRTLVAKMKKTGATIIWGTVTPVWEGEAGKLNADEDAFNKVAEKVMKENGVIIDDLNSEVRRQGQPKSNNVHDVGNLAPKVTDTILAALAARNNNTKPLPRVLLIGDSITGTYLDKVTKNLDGKATVSKNPGNAEDTWNGLEKIDQWLDLKQYLQSGQEYLELVNGVKDSLKQLDRFCPGYQKQGYELAGLIWCQGIADSFSPAQTKAYEKNLASLIRDIRKDLGVPKLPVVVAALGYPEAKVHDAQMAVGYPAKYPEFAGNVTSVDTRPFFRPAEQSPGGRSQYFFGNAESFLEIGDAMGRATLELTNMKK